MSARISSGTIDKRGWIGLGAACVVAAGVFCGLAALMRSQQRALVSLASVQSQILTSGELRPVVDVCEAIRSMKLVTTEVTGQVQRTVADEKWRGDAVATVEAPVTYHYGVDLSRLAADHVRIDRLINSYRVRVPHPVRIASELNMEKRVERVSVTGTRLRSRAGEYVLGLARVGIHQAAKESMLAPEQMRVVGDQTLARVEELVRAVVGPAPSIEVEFSDEPVLAFQSLRPSDASPR